jgi:hypothetical protein
VPKVQIGIEFLSNRTRLRERREDQTEAGTDCAIVGPDSVAMIEKQCSPVSEQVSGDLVPFF